MSDEGRTPPHNLDAERAALGAVLIEPAALTKLKADLKPDYFFDPYTRETYEAMLRLHERGTPIDVLTLSDELRAKGARQPAELAYLRGLAEATATAQNVRYYIEIIRRHEGLRRWLIARSQPFDPGPELARNLEQIRELLRPLADEDTFARPLAEDPAWLAPDEPDEFLLAHGNGGLILRGTTGLVASGGGVGKTWLMITLAVKVAAGGGTWGPLTIRSWGGRVLLLLREGSHRSLRRRLRTVIDHFGLGPEEKAAVERRLVLPRLDLERSVRLQQPLKRDGGNEDETPFVRRLLGSLRRQSWDLVVFDPLVKFAGPEAETDNGAADRLHDIFAEFTRLPGNPTVLVTHHMTKEALKAMAAGDEFDAASASRGSSALTNGFRVQVNLVKKDGGVELSVPKQNDGVELTGQEVVRFDRSRDGLLILKTPQSSVEVDT